MQRNVAAASEPAKPDLADFGRECHEGPQMSLGKTHRGGTILGVNLGSARPPRSPTNFAEKHKSSVYGGLGKLTCELKKLRCAEHYCMP